MVRLTALLLVSLLAAFPLASALWIPAPNLAFPNSVVYPYAHAQPFYPPYAHPPKHAFYPPQAHPPKHVRPPFHPRPPHHPIIRPPMAALPVDTITDTQRLERLILRTPNHCRVSQQQLRELTVRFQTQRVFMDVGGREELVLLVNTDRTRAGLASTIGDLRPSFCVLMTYSGWRVVLLDV